MQCFMYLYLYQKSGLMVKWLPTPDKQGDESIGTIKNYELVQELNLCYLGLDAIFPTSLSIMVSEFFVGVN